MNRKQKSIASAGVLLCIFAVCTPVSSSVESPNDLVVFVNNTSSVSNLSADELKQIYLKKKNNWPGGEQIVSINAEERSSVRETFRKRVLIMTAEEESTYWENQRIRYQLAAPSEVTNGPKAVFKMKSAVAYAYRKDVPRDVVKIVFTIPQ